MNTKRQSTKFLSHIHSCESVHTTMVSTQKMSPDVMSDNPVPPGKCHFPVTFEDTASRTFSHLCDLTVKNPGAQFAASLHPIFLSCSPRFQTPLTLRPPVKNSHPFSALRALRDLAVKNSDALPPCPKATPSIPRIILYRSPICENLFNLWITTFNPVEYRKCPNPVLKMSFLKKRHGHQPKGSGLASKPTPTRERRKNS
ncbi:MAG: hypothetical protein JWM04_1525 [Verrucomicrobiales bacterium]|nr:hypothetical protein [Verrucomicrobiales bacterium]